MNASRRLHPPTLADAAIGQPLTVAAVAAPGGVLTVVVPTPVPRGSTLLADFTGATWVGAKPTLVLMDEQGNVLDESKYLFLSNGKLTINTLLGSILFLR